MRRPAPAAKPTQDFEEETHAHIHDYDSCVQTLMHFRTHSTCQASHKIHTHGCGRYQTSLRCARTVCSLHSRHHAFVPHFPVIPVIGSGANFPSFGGDERGVQIKGSHRTPCRLRPDAWLWSEPNQTHTGITMHQQLARTGATGRASQRDPRRGHRSGVVGPGRWRRDRDRRCDDLHHTRRSSCRA